MKHNYKIIVDPKKMSGEDIAKHKDFDALLHQFQHAQKKPAPRKGGVSRQIYMWVGASAAALLALLLYFTVGVGQSYEDQSFQHFASQDYVNPPVKEALAKFATHKINANQGGVYEYQSGSRLVVPASAFVDDKGKLIEGEVEIKYREYHDFVDFFLSGIPMTYDSSGVVYTLESAGMMEIYAEQNGQKVRMAEGKSIEVELVSHVNVPPNMNVPPSYNIYKLDDQKRNWVYQDIDKMQLVEDETETTTLEENDPAYDIKKAYFGKLEAIEINRTNQLAEIEKTIPKIKEPLKPKQYNSNDHAFALEFDDLAAAFDDNNLSQQDETDFAAAKADLEKLYREYEEMLWQISPQSNISPNRLKEEFGLTEGIRIKKVNNRDFEFTLIKGNKATKVIVNPILTGSDYEKAIAAFNQEYALFETQMAERESKLEEAKTALKERIDEELKMAEADYQSKLAQFQNTGQGVRATDLIVKRKVINRFQATSFGIWNCDRPLPPLMSNLKANFIDQHGNKYDQNIGYLVDKSRNTVGRFYVAKNTPLTFNRNSENLMWIITKDNKIALFSPESFKRVNQPKGSYNFEMTLIDKEIKTEEDVREVLLF